MPEAFEHLCDGARRALALSVEERENYMNRDHWVTYPVADTLLSDLQKLLQGERVLRMPCRMIYGETNNGKTRLVNRFKKLSPPIETPEGLVVEVLLIDNIGEASVRGLYNKIIDAFGFPNNPSEQIDKLEFKAYRLLVRYRVRVLALDEFNAIAQDTPTKQRKFMEKLKALSNNLKISIVAAGTREAFNVTRLDSQFSNRFKPLPLDIWTSGDDWDQLLMTFEKLLPLPEPSYLADGRFSRLILANSEGTIGDAFQLIREMASYAMHNHKPRVTPDMFAAIDWVPPSERSTVAQKRTARAIR